jgi:type IV pilus assembly protein PilO
MSVDYMQDAEFDNAPSYPTVFGLTLTPMISGVLLGLLGVAGFGAIVAYLVMPTWETYQALDTKVKEKSEQLKTQDSIRKQIQATKDKLVKVKQQRDQVYALFADQKSMDTVLLDLNQQIEKSNVDVNGVKRQKISTCPPLIQTLLADDATYRKFKDQFGDLSSEARLSKFQPDAKLSGVIIDGTYGAPIDNKLKRQVMDIQFQANFNQTQSILRRIEMLKPLLLVKELKMTINGEKGENLFYYDPVNNQVSALSCQPEAQITTSFKLEALLPLTDADRKLVEQSAAAAAKKK